MSSANSVAKELVRLSLSGPTPDLMTPYRLHCLSYLAQAWSLVLRDSELFPDDIQAREEGPVVSGLLVAANVGVAQPVLGAESFAVDPPLDDEDEAVFLSHLWTSYGALSPSGLFALVQSEAPFLEAKSTLGGAGAGLIATAELREHFAGRAQLPAPLAEYRRQRQERVKEAEAAILNSPPLDAEAIWAGCQSATPSAAKR